MEEQDKKIGGKIDRLVMGIILGGAIGSVLGLTLAPKKGKETRAIIKQTGQDLIEKGKEVSEKLVRDHKETFESAKYQFKKGGRSFLGWFLGLVRSKKTEAKMPHAEIDEEK